MPCTNEPAFGEMWALVHSETLLEERLRSLSHQISDANLKQMPEFHQRVEVLREMGYVSSDYTVQMKASLNGFLQSRDQLIGPIQMYLLSAVV